MPGPASQGWLAGVLAGVASCPAPQGLHGGAGDAGGAARRCFTRCCRRGPRRGCGAHGGSDGGPCAGGERGGRGGRAGRGPGSRRRAGRLAGTVYERVRVRRSDLGPRTRRLGTRGPGGPGHGACRGRRGKGPRRRREGKGGGREGAEARGGSGLLQGLQAAAVPPVAGWTRTEALLPSRPSRPSFQALPCCAAAPRVRAVGDVCGLSAGCLWAVSQWPAACGSACCGSACGQRTGRGAGAASAPDNKREGKYAVFGSARARFESSSGLQFPDARVHMQCTCNAQCARERDTRGLVLSRGPHHAAARSPERARQCSRDAPVTRR